MAIVFIIIQMIGIVVPAAGIFAQIFKEQNRTSMYLMLTNIGCLIMNTGYMLLLLSKGNDTARMALNMEYLGNVMFYFFCVLFILSYLQIRIRKWWWILAIWAFQDLMDLVAVWSGLWDTWVYRSLSFEREAGIMFMKASYGGLHAARYGLASAFLLGLLIYTTYRMFHTEKGKKRNNLAKLAGAQFVIVTSLSLVVSISPSYDISPLFSALAIMSIIIGVLQGDFFSVIDRGKAWLVEHMENAFIITDRYYGYQDANAYAKTLFPELGELTQSEKLPEEILEMFQRVDSQIQVGKLFFEKTLIEIGKDEEDTGYGLLLMNVTEQRRMLEELGKAKEAAEEAQLEAEEANQAKSAFMSNMSGHLYLWSIE